MRELVVSRVNWVVGICGWRRIVGSQQEGSGKRGKEAMRWLLEASYAERKDSNCVKLRGFHLWCLIWWRRGYSARANDLG